MARPANAIDFWRGFALITIFINHIPGLYYERFTHRNLSLSDSADLFVFLAGWALRLVAGPADAPTPTAPLVFRLGRRAVTIYIAQILIISIAIAMLAAGSKLLDNPLLLEWHNAAAVFYDPVNAHIGLVLLTHQLGYFDILPLYVVLMLLAPLIVIIHRRAPNWLLPISLAVYFVTLGFQINVPTWPTDGQWFLNPLAWQLVFILGFTMARDHGISGVVRRHLFTIRIIAIPVVLLGALQVYTEWWPDPSAVPRPKLFFLLWKTYVTPPRLIQFLALVVVFSATYVYIRKWARPLTEVFSILGRNSLNVFCVSSLLSIASQIVRLAVRPSFFVDTIILMVGVTLLWVTAWLSEWRETPRPMS